jgi:hypothetical protein
MEGLNQLVQIFLDETFFVRFNLDLFHQIFTIRKPPL